MWNFSSQIFPFKPLYSRCRHSTENLKFRKIRQSKCFYYNKLTFNSTHWRGALSGQDCVKEVTMWLHFLLVVPKKHVIVMSVNAELYSAGFHHSWLDWIIWSICVYYYVLRPCVLLLFDGMNTTQSSNILNSNSKTSGKNNLLKVIV